MSDTPEEIARRRKLFKELRELEEALGEVEDPSPDEVVALLKKVRKELAEERAKGEQK